jgi:hypothetical protein
MLHSTTPHPISCCPRLSVCERPLVFHSYDVNVNGRQTIFQCHRIMVNSWYLSTAYRQWNGENSGMKNHFFKFPALYCRDGCTRASPGLKIAKVIVTLRLTVSLGVEPTLGLVTRCYFLSENCCVVSAGRPLWREDGSAVFSANLKVVMKNKISRIVKLKSKKNINIFTYI